MEFVGREAGFSDDGMYAMQRSNAPAGSQVQRRVLGGVSVRSQQARQPAAYAVSRNRCTSPMMLPAVRIWCGGGKGPLRGRFDECRHLDSPAKARWTPRCAAQRPSALSSSQHRLRPRSVGPRACAVRPYTTSLPSRSILGHARSGRSRAHLFDTTARQRVVRRSICGKKQSSPTRDCVAADRSRCSHAR